MINNYELINRLGYALMKFNGDTVTIDGQDIERKPEYFISLSEIYISIDDTIFELYLKVNDTYFDNSQCYKLNEFLTALKVNQGIYDTGIEGFRPGEDYFLCESLYKKLHDGALDYLKTRPDLFINWTMYKDDKLIISASNENKILNMSFTEDEFNNLCKTFFKYILEYTTIDDETRNEPLNQIYNMVMNFYKNGGTDSAYQMLQLLLNSSININGINPNNTASCGCNSSLSNTNNIGNNPSCSDIYKSAILSYLKQMLGDTQYYKDWFNDNVSDVLIKLLNEFLQLNYSLDFSSQNNGLDCPSLKSNIDECNKGIIKNYIKVLNFVKNDDIDCNKNKIKIYGEAFAELLPLLIFK